MHRIDGPGATGANQFTEGNPEVGTPATTVTADLMNALQEEIIAVIDEAGIVLDKEDNAQLQAAITSLIDAAVAAAISGVSGFLAITNNLSDLDNASTARGNLGLGSAAVQNDTRYAHRANNLSDLANAATARTNLGLAALAVLSTINNSHWSGTDLAVVNGGTGASDAAGARTNLGAAAASHTHSAADITSGTLPVARGGTGVSTKTGTGSVVLSASPTFTGTASFATITASGDITGLTSDERLKWNWGRLDSVLDRMRSVRVGTFDFTPHAYALNEATPPGRHLGFSAQDIQRHWPEAVARAPFDVDPVTGDSISGKDYLTLKYERLVPVLWQAVLDLRAEVADLRSAVDART